LLIPTTAPVPTTTPLPATLPAPASVLMPVAVLQPAREVANTGDATAAVVNPQPISWQDWLTIEPRRGVRAVRRRQWRFETNVLRKGA
jgi:hypothetical protein